jgi:hypothetical protein
MSYHDEIRELLEEISMGTQDGDGFPAIEQLREQAEKLLALPEESIDKLVQAAHLGVEAVQVALSIEVDQDDGDPASWAQVGDDDPSFGPGFGA